MDRQRTVILGDGVSVPYPEPSSLAATTIGKANKRTDSKAEVRLRSLLHRGGMRFRKDLLVRAGAVKVHIDIAFTRRRLAVFVDGCFWHACPIHGTAPKSNVSYWSPKLDANVARDRRVDAALTEHGWEVLRLWEHVSPDEAAAAVHTMYGMPPHCF